MFIEFRGGAVLVLAFMLCYTGKWHRRSGCMTGAEWMIYRFGNGKDAGLVRVISAVGVLLSSKNASRSKLDFDKTIAEYIPTSPPIVGLTSYLSVNHLTSGTLSEPADGISS